MTATMFPSASYPADFEVVWRAYHPCKNDSKAMALKAFEKSKRRRLHCGAFGPRLVLCIEMYGLWLEAENAKRAKQRQSDHPRAYFSTFFNQDRWEGFLEDADAKLRAQRAPADLARFAGWERQAESIIREKGRPVFDAWFAGMTYKPGAPCELVFARPYQAQRVATAFSSVIRREFGACFLTVADAPSYRWELP